MDELLLAIRDAFSWRKKPDQVVDDGPPDSDIYQDALAFSGLTWEETNGDMWHEFWEAAAGFSPEAFCYFIPGIMTASITGKKHDLLVVDLLMSCLNRSLTPEYWDDFFLERWPKLSKKECQVIQDWIFLCWKDLYLSDDDALRCCETLELLKAQAG